MTRILRAVSLVVLLRALSLMGGELMSGYGDLDMAESLDPLSFNVRETKIEVLMLTGRREEAVIVARDARSLFPGYFQAQSAYATALAMHTLHGKPEYLAATKREARKALERDPAGITSIDRLMFLLAAGGDDTGLEEFRRLGVYRAEISRTAGVAMRCRLCGRHWLQHRQIPRAKSVPSSGPRSLVSPLRAAPDGAGATAWPVLPPRG